MFLISSGDYSDYTVWATTDDEELAKETCRYLNTVDDSDYQEYEYSEITHITVRPVAVHTVMLTVTLMVDGSASEIREYTHMTIAWTPEEAEQLLELKTRVEKHHCSAQRYVNRPLPCKRHNEHSIVQVKSGNKTKARRTIETLIQQHSAKTAAMRGDI